MPAGRLRTLLDVLENKPRRDGAGQLVENWKPLRKQVAFELTPTGGGEGRRGAQVEANVTHLAGCRYFAGASPQLQLAGGGRTFRVERVVDRDERRRWLDWQLVEAVK